MLSFHSPSLPPPVEFYFNDSNLPYDKFLWTTQALPSGQGWVSIALIASFKRMRDHLHKGIPWIAEALRRSDGLLEVDEKGEKVRRRTEVKPQTDAFGRSAYVVRFPFSLPHSLLPLLPLADPMVARLGGTMAEGIPGRQPYAPAGARVVVRPVWKG